VAPLRPRRGRNLFGRLRQSGRSSDAAPQAPSGRDAGEPVVYDVLDDVSGAPDALLAAPLRETSQGARLPVFAGGERDLGERAAAGASPSWIDPDPAASQAPPAGHLERALEMFNAGEHPRRIAGVARSLGVPSVSVRPDKDFGTLVSIVIAWELCWYRYGVDVEDRDGGARVLAQGTELSELAREERLANAVADDLGALSLAAA
jgi:hypothetical protein